MKFRNFYSQRRAVRSAPFACTVVATIRMQLSGAGGFGSGGLEESSTGEGAALRGCVRGVVGVLRPCVGLGCRMGRELGGLVGGAGGGRRLLGAGDVVAVAHEWIGYGPRAGLVTLCGQGWASLVIRAGTPGEVRRSIGRLRVALRSTR
jgi:hypothetical protein